MSSSYSAQSTRSLPKSSGMGHPSCSYNISFPIALSHTPPPSTQPTGRRSFDAAQAPGRYVKWKVTFYFGWASFLTLPFTSPYIPSSHNFPALADQTILSRSL
ncbi:hypothetical protein M422DRAFT_259128 [Sphaerobolus stellatus SS14]|uniref:Uncharacterized protein n=1 Tax=Sphaerobolus stellatus (strain SS14) TaxID=990650 RepID=A0A0C9V9K1_SPHS4|nr:hypothetical protein M422DRAFT_259128 [Sphaerobolus stellatus SS14]